jgi:starch synthase
MRVVMLTSEAHPWAKTGGLADVLGALPTALGHVGVEATVVLPGYRAALDRAGAALTPRARVWAPVSSRMEPIDVYEIAGAPVHTVLLAADKYFDRPELYGTRAGDYPDNAERFVVFCRAALEWLRGWPRPPDVLHAHDWQAGLAPAFLRGTADLYPELREVRLVHTIHNLAYQGRFWAADWHLLNLDPRWFRPEWLESWSDINFLKAGIVFADAITTVSPRYAREIQTPDLGEGLDGTLRARADRLHGILNGVDVEAWNPATDPALAAAYGPGSLAGKARCKAALQSALKLAVDADVPLLAVITRLATQKGMDLLLAVLPDLFATTDVQLAVLGNGDPGLERAFAELAASLPGRMTLRLGFDEPLAHRMQGGADVLVMPSRYEPCGLAQMYALRYGTVPVVHATGGLDDTVVEGDPARVEATGFKFARYTPDALRGAIDRALAARRHPAVWRALRDRGMAVDFSWDRSARTYRGLYGALLDAPVVVPSPA